jgi:hypothetical protein
MINKFKSKMTSMVLGDSKLESLTPSGNAPYRPSIMVHGVGAGSLWPCYALSFHNCSRLSFETNLRNNGLLVLKYCACSVWMTHFANLEWFSFWIWEKCLTNVFFCNGIFFWVCALKAYANLYDMFVLFCKLFFFTLHLGCCLIQVIWGLAE